ncbi:hypothetical protein ACOTJF_19300 [Achromobacter ruhlandii]|uniref:hypothetical protein n=1 Tax=Achromobacter ruhlandii TaxID=72557 RepID=UPI000A9B3F49|nr:hypothetical protein [Achromobacter ruhlandii]MCZ8396525.1 hypothetical protein [Achromobacter ruhlandii]
MGDLMRDAVECGAGAQDYGTVGVNPRASGQALFPCKDRKCGGDAWTGARRRPWGNPQLQHFARVAAQLLQSASI